MVDASARPAPDIVERLVERFEAEHDRVFNREYKEANLRQDFLAPLFRALGWDTANSLEVQDERTVKIKGETKSVDVAFKLNNRLKFMLEAKKPASKVEGNREYALQARRYGWNASIPFVILSDFEEFVVYDTTVRPKESDSANVALLESFTCKQYAEKWDFLWSKFSKEAVQAGSLDQWSEKVHGKQKRIRVDASLLEDIEGWRIQLAKRVIAKNHLESHQLAEVVQLLLDRILFLRICEDRGLEAPGRLAGLLEGTKVYDRLKRFFHLADQKYNAGLFYLEEEKGRGHPDSLSPSLIIDDDVLKEVVRGLYDKNKPYDFAVIPTEILGQVYEQFLGTVLRITASGDRVKPEVKPEVQEAGGVFYTPTYIVEHIVNMVVGPLLKGKTPMEVSTIKIVDPACGSGSFLLGAYQFLLDWHLAWYLKDGVKKHPRELVALRPGQWVLSVEERKRILRNNIYGVDIDRQATEVTKLSLFLKVVEETAGQALETNQKLFEKRVLPSLEGNIKCGNSLVEPSHVPQQSFDQADMQTARRVNAFSWRQGFGPIMEKGGFDAVVGNPPYIRVQALNRFAPLEVELYKKHYKSAAKGNYDIYVAFVERGLQLLNSTGRLGYILPHKFFNAQYGEPLRSLIAAGKHLAGVIHFGDQQVFDNATTYTCLLFLNKAGVAQFDFVRVPNLGQWRLGGKASAGQVSATKVGSADWNFNVGEGSGLFDRLSQMPVKLGDVAHLFVGLQTDADDVFIVEQVRREGNRVLCNSKATGKEHWFEDDHLKHFLKGSLNIRRYYLSDVTKRLIFPYESKGGKSVLISANEYEKRFPLTWAYLLENRSRLSERNKGQMGKDWHSYVYKKNHERLGTPKLLVPSLGTGACFAADLEGRYFFVGSGGGGGGGYGIAPFPEYAESPLCLLGLLNSRILSHFLRGISTPFRGGYLALNKQVIEQLPIARFDFAESKEKARHDRLVGLVEGMLCLHNERNASKSQADRELIQRQIDETDGEIDTLVYELYGLTDEERGFVEATN